MKKKAVSILLALVLCLGLLPTAASAVNRGFVIENGVLTKYNGTGGNVVIPNGVTEIGGSAFNGCVNLTSITIPASVTKIGSLAFRGCTSLVSVTIPSSVTEIGYQAFSNCTGLTSAGPVGGGYSYEFQWTEKIPDNAFHGCSKLVSVTIPDSITTIGASAFQSCQGLTSITFPNRVTTIERYAFYGCAKLTNVTIPSSVTEIGANAFGDCQGLIGIAIPDSVTSIGGRAFYNTPWLKSFGEYAVLNRILLAYQGSGNSVTIPDGITVIGPSAFHGCTGLTSVTIPDGVTSIGENAFYKCTGLTSVTIPDSVTEIGPYAFYDCTSLTSITIPDSVTEIGAGTFDGCASLSSVTIPASITRIGPFAFSDCTGLTGVTIPAGVTEIGDDAFTNCPNLTLYGDANSKAEACAHKYDIPFRTYAAGFVDVPATSWYATGVVWAVNNGITEGAGNGTFAPERICTNGEIITFLWRANKKPVASVTAPVEAPAYFRDAVNWAYAQGIIDHSFQSGASCPRADIVTYIWKAFRRPAASTHPSFHDVSANAAYFMAVSWAVENGITTGTGDGNFSPYGTCTRHQVVTFLSRAY